jgi:REP element-mobilizing transposase RayT
MNNLRFREFYKRRLPHFQVKGATYFVTFRLKNSLPIEVLEKLSQEFEQIKRLPKDKIETEQYHWFEKFDSYLDQVLNGHDYLRNPQIAGVVEEAMHYRNMKVYDLIVFCIMPNHVHLIFTPLEKEKETYFSLTEILHSLKRHTSRQSNLILNQSGPFW